MTGLNPTLSQVSTNLSRNSRVVSCPSMRVTAETYPPTVKVKFPRLRDFNRSFSYWASSLLILLK